MVNFGPQTLKRDGDDDRWANFTHNLTNTVGLRHIQRILGVERDDLTVMDWVDV